MDDVSIGKGKLAGKGVYAARDFSVGEIIKYYRLKPLTQADFYKLPESEKMCVHSFWGKMYLFPEPSRYTNHSPHPNTESDLDRMCDVAIRPIKKGEMITTNATLEVRKEVQTFLEVYEGVEVRDLKWLRGGYRNAEVSYATVSGLVKTLVLKRIDGNWHFLKKDGITSLS